MKTIILTISIKILLSLTLLGQVEAADKQWNLAFQIGGNGMVTAYDVAVDDQGNTVTVGTFTETLNIESEQLESYGNTSIVLARHDADGNLLWIKKFGGSGYDYGYAVELDEQNNIYIGGAFSTIADFGGEQYTAAGQRDAYLAKLSPEGEIQWFKHLLSEGRDFVYDLTLTGEGDIAVAGRFSEELNFSDQTLQVDRENDGFGALINPEGQVQWAERFSSRGGVRATTVATRGDALYFGIEFQADVTISGTTHASRGNHDLALARFDLNGDLEWSRHMEGYGSDSINDIDIAPDGRVAMIGHFNNDLEFGDQQIESKNRDDLYVALFEANGDYGWIRQGKSEFWSYGRGILARENDIVIAGHFYMEFDLEGLSLERGETDYQGLMGKIDYEGNPQSIEKIGGDRSDYTEGITLGANESFYVFGRFYGEFEAGRHQLTSQNSSDIFVAQYGGIGSPANPIITEFDTETDGDSLYVTVELRDVSDLYFMSFELSYDDDLLTFERMTPGEVMGSNPLFISGDTESGTGISIGKTSGTAANMDGELMTVVFSTIEPNYDTESELGVHDLKAESPDNKTLPVDYPGTVPFTLQSAFVVWPGDVNNDGVVDERDALALAQHLGKSGVPRSESEQGISWEAAEAEPWEDTSATFADTDGDGVVDYEDLRAIVFNFGKSHSQGDGPMRQLATTGNQNQQENSGYRLPALREGETHRITISSDIDGLVTGASIRARVSGVDEEAFTIKSINPGVWADSYRSDEVLKFNYVNGATAAAAIAASEVLSLNEDQLFEITIRADRSWSSAPELVVYPVSVSDTEGGQTQLANEKTRVLDTGSNSELPQRTELIGNYPNPFNPETSIRFNLSEEAHVELSIYDLLGNRITSLVDEQRSPGNYTVPFSGHNLSSGVYIYRLSAGGHTETKTMTMVK